jgi:isoleucyl-tRNA synthetase
MKAQIESVADLILAEVNVKALEYIDERTAVVAKKIKPNLKQLGQRYKAQMKAITEAIAQLNQADIKAFETQQSWVITVGEERIKLDLEDVLITPEDIPGWSVANQGAITVALDMTIDDTLRREGIARDLVNRVQNMRKDQGLAVQDKIKLVFSSEYELVNQAIEEHEVYICQETQALQLSIVDGVVAGEKVNIDDYTLDIQVVFVGVSS